MKKKLFLTVGILAFVAASGFMYCHTNCPKKNNPVIEQESVHLIPADKTVKTSVVLYENGRGFVSQTRRDTLKKGIQDITFGKITKHLILPSVSVFGKSIQIQTQNFDPIYENKTLYELAQEQAIGKEVVLLWSVWKDGNLTEIKKKATLLAVQDKEPILLIDGLIHQGTDAKILYPEAENTQQKNPALDFTVNSDSDKPQDITMSFLTTGFSWNTNYIVSLDENENKMNLKGYVSLYNNSGFDYKNTSVDFVLGDFNMQSHSTELEKEPAQCQINQKSGIKIDSDKTTVNGQFIEKMSENGRIINRDDDVMGRIYDSDGAVYDLHGNIIGRVANTHDSIVRDLKDYYVYRLPFKTNLKDGKPVQALFLNYDNLPYQKEYEFNLGNIGYAKNLSPALFLIFDNQKEAGVGMPLPKGTFRVFNQSQEDSFFVGEARVDKTLALGQKARLNIGEALDVYADISQTNFKELSDTKKEYTYSMTITNVSDEEKSIIINKDFDYIYSLLISSDLEYSGYRTIQWAFKLPANSSKTFSWTMQEVDVNLIKKRRNTELEKEKLAAEEARLEAEKEYHRLKLKR